MPNFTYMIKCVFVAFCRCGTSMGIVIICWMQGLAIQLISHSSLYSRGVWLSLGGTGTVGWYISCMCVFVCLCLCVCVSVPGAYLGGGGGGGPSHKGAPPPTKSDAKCETKWTHEKLCLPTKNKPPPPPPHIPHWQNPSCATGMCMCMLLCLCFCSHLCVND